MNEFTIRDLGRLFILLWRNKWVIVFITISGFLAGMSITAPAEPDVNYRAMSSVCVTYTTYQEQVRGSTVMASYSDLITSRLVSERISELLDDTGLSASEISRMIDKAVSANSYVMYIYATADDPQLAIRVANAAAQAFTEKVSSVSGNSSLQVLDVAYNASTLSSTVSRTLVIITLAPFVFVCMWIILREVYSGKIRYLSQCAQEQGELLGILPVTK